jgi:hypothetical protein
VLTIGSARPSRARRLLENLGALAVVIAVPTAILWLIGLALGAMQRAVAAIDLAEDPTAWLWFAAVVGGPVICLALIYQLLLLAEILLNRPPRGRRLTK